MSLFGHRCGYQHRSGMSAHPEVAPGSNSAARCSASYALIRHFVAAMRRDLASASISNSWARSRSLSGA